MQTKGKDNPSTLRAWVVGHVQDSPTPVTLTELVSRGVSATDFSPREIRQAVRELVENRDLAYIQRLGHVFIEPSFQKPVRISPRIVVQPQNMEFTASGGDIVISLQGGISFGSGSHPTTRLCLRAMDDFFSHPSRGLRVRGGRMLDIGTGTGVLLVAGILLGCQSGIGLDVDACARSEAAENFRINGVDKQAAASDTPIEDLSKPFDLITANLRPPTLHQMEKEVSRLAAETGAMVISGFRASEAPPLMRRYEDAGWRSVCQAEEKGWVGVTLMRDKGDSAE